MQGGIGTMKYHSSCVNPENHNADGITYLHSRNIV